MKKLLALCATLLVALLATMFATPALAATDVSGSWNGSVSTPNGDMQLTFTFKAEGDKLTGTVQGPMGDPMEITNGKVDGGNISFDITFNGMTIHHTGTTSGDEIKMASKSDSGDFPAMEMTLKRDKPQAK